MNQPLRHSLAFLILASCALAPSSSMAWGQRAHHTICDAAVFLLKEQGLKNFLQNKPNTMGHLCNIPDIHWKNLGSDSRSFGDPAHYVDTELIEMPISQIPTDYSEIIAKFTGTNSKFENKPIISIPKEFGSNWWRADQFYRRAVAAGKNIQTATAPTNSKEEFDANLPFNKFIFDFTVNLGLLGHFVGDNSQPFHLTADYDGYRSGHGGIHSYYEDSVAGTMPYDLQALVVKEGMRLQSLVTSKSRKEKSKVKFLTEKTVVEKMRALGELSFADLPKIFKLDPVVTKSELKIEKGMTLKTAAVRRPADTVSRAFQPLVISEMARAAALTAQVWDDAYRAIGSPKLAASKTYNFPMTPEFVLPDYYELTPEKK